MSETNKEGLPVFLPLVEKCEGCERTVLNEDRCAAYISPTAKWRNGICNLATHVTVTEESALAKKTRVGQQKQKKKSR